MRPAILLFALAISGCAQSDKRKASDPPVIVEYPKLSERVRTSRQEHEKQQVAERNTAETTVEGAVTR